ARGGARTLPKALDRRRGPPGPGQGRHPRRTDAAEQVTGQRRPVGVLSAKQAPHRPGTAPPLGLRAGNRAVPLESRPGSPRRFSTMLFASFFRYLDFLRLRPQAQRRRSRPGYARSVGRPLFLERLETRVVPGFLAPLSFDAGSRPDAVAVGDFNGDG